jgi:hypothetical protein
MSRRSLAIIVVLGLAISACAADAPSATNRGVTGPPYVPAAEATSASAAATLAPATSPPVAPSATDTSQDAIAVVQPPVAFTGRSAGDSRSIDAHCHNAAT